ncbi:MAG: mechanosensitive ion channel family protein [Candidatus Marsarchaeota archaeon]|nr:mechanosensitive ion channel family protein [Candidatus Marsarchaeota archaeon]MCL5105820.1 mechanosensitive ion channel family protein [Candidatus Marsarchaeota archaeon]
MRGEYKKILAILFLIIAIGVIVLSGIHIYFFKALSSSYKTIIDFAAYALLGVATIEFIAFLFKIYGRRAHVGNYIKSITTIFRVFSYLILIIILLNFLKVNVNGLLIGAGFLGVVLGLAAQTSLGNVFAGISLLSLKPFHIGDKITISTWVYPQIPPTYPHDIKYVSITGKVIEIGLIYTTIQGTNNELFYMPNNALNQALIINHNKVNKKEILLTFEINANKDFELFKKELEGRIKKDSYLSKVVLKHSINVAFINNASYGVKFKATIDKENEGIIKNKIMGYAVKLMK